MHLILIIEFNKISDEVDFKTYLMAPECLAPTFTFYTFYKISGHLGFSADGYYTTTSIYYG